MINRLVLDSISAYFYMRFVALFPCCNVTTPDWGTSGESMDKRKFDEMNVFCPFHRTFSFYMPDYIKPAMNSFMAGSQLQASW